jgi:hypothetical protein
MLDHDRWVGDVASYCSSIARHGRTVGSTTDAVMPGTMVRFGFAIATRGFGSTAISVTALEY